MESKVCKFCVKKFYRKDYFTTNQYGKTPISDYWWDKRQHCSPECSKKGCKKTYDNSEKGKEKKKINDAKYYARNTEKIKKKTNKYFQNYKEEELIKHDIWRKNNPDKMNGFRSTWRENNPEKDNQSKRDWDERNPEKSKQIKQNFAKSPAGKLSSNRAFHKRRAKKNDVIENWTNKEWIEKRDATKGICQNCKQYVGIEKLTKEHNPSIDIAPEGFEYTIDDILVWCGHCNSSKGHDLVFPVKYNKELQGFEIDIPPKWIMSGLFKKGYNKKIRRRKVGGVEHFVIDLNKKTSNK